MRSFLSVVFFSVAAIAAPLEPARVSSTDNVVSRSIDAFNMACKPIIMFYARGTWEKPWPEPGTPKQVAAPLLSTLEKIYPGKIDFRNVRYDGGAIGYISRGDLTGSKLYETMVKAAASECPNSKLLLVGYSQGSQLLKNAVKALPADVKSHIKAIFMIGDPNWSSHSQAINRPKGMDPNDPQFGVGLANKSPIFPGISNAIIIIHCDTNDYVCNGIPLAIGIHDDYTSRVEKGNMARQIAKVLGPA